MSVRIMQNNLSKPSKNFQSYYDYSWSKSNCEREVGNHYKTVKLNTTTRDWNQFDSGWHGENNKSVQKTKRNIMSRRWWKEKGGWGRGLEDFWTSLLSRKISRVQIFYNYKYTKINAKRWHKYIRRERRLRVHQVWERPRRGKKTFRHRDLSSSSYKLCS